MWAWYRALGTVKEASGASTKKKKKKKAGCEKKYLKDSSEWKPSSETLLTVAPPKGARDHSTLQGCPISTIVEEEFMEAI